MPYEPFLLGVGVVPNLLSPVILGMDTLSLESKTGTGVLAKSPPRELVTSSFRNTTTPEMIAQIIRK